MSLGQRLRKALVRGEIRNVPEDCIRWQQDQEDRCVGPVTIVDDSVVSIYDSIARELRTVRRGVAAATASAADHGSIVAQLHRFETRDPRGPLVLVASDVASVGLDLQHAASDLIFFDLPWNPLRAEQWIGRLDRLGSRGSLRRRDVGRAVRCDRGRGRT